MIKTRLLKLLKGSGKYIGANIFWQWIALLFQIAAVFAAGNMIQQLFEKTLDQQVMLQTAGIVILAICARFLCEKGAAYASYRASADVKTVLRKQIYEKLLRLGAAYKEKVSTSEVVQGLRKESSSWRFIMGDIFRSCSTVCLHRSHCLRYCHRSASRHVLCFLYVYR